MLLVTLGSEFKILVRLIYFLYTEGGVSCLWLELTSAGMLSLGTLPQVKEDVEKKDRSTTSSIYGALRSGGTVSQQSTLASTLHSIYDTL